MTLPRFSAKSLRRCKTLGAAAIAVSTFVATGLHAAATLKLSPSSGPANTQIKITGVDFTANPGSVLFGKLTPVSTNWTANEIDVTPPDLGAKTKTQLTVTVKDSGGTVLGEATFTETPTAAPKLAAASAGSSAQTSTDKWGDEDENPVGLNFIGGYEQGFQSAQQANSYGFINLYGRRLFGKAQLGPLYSIRLQTAPQASNANGIVSVFTNPSGAITTQSLQGVGSAVDLSVGLEKNLVNNLNRGQTSLDFIVAGGFVTPVQANTVSATFTAPAIGTVECAELQSRLAATLSQPQYKGITPNTDKSCYANTNGASPVPITALLYATPDRTSFYFKAYGGLRLINRWPDTKGDTECSTEKHCERGIVDFTFGQNASITAGKMRHFVFTIDAIHPLPVASVNFIYLFGSISKRVNEAPQILPPLILNPASAISGAPTSADLVLPLTQPDRDFYRIGAGISLNQIFKALTASKTSASQTTDSKTN